MAQSSENMNYSDDFGLADFLASLEGQGYEVKPDALTGLYRIIDAVAPVIIDDSRLGEGDYSLAINKYGHLRGVRRVLPGIKTRCEAHPEIVQVGVFSGDEVTTYDLEVFQPPERFNLGVVLWKGYDRHGRLAVDGSCAEMVREATVSPSAKYHRQHDVSVQYASFGVRGVFDWFSYDIPDDFKPLVIIDRLASGLLAPAAYLSEGVNDNLTMRDVKHEENPNLLSFKYRGRHFSVVEKGGGLEFLIENGSSAEQVTAQLEVSAETCAAMYAAAASDDRWFNLPDDFHIVQAFSVRERS